MERLNTNNLVLRKILLYGLHIGGLKSFWDPGMKMYVMGSRYGFCLIDLKALQRNIRLGLRLISKLVLSKKKILFVGAPKGMEKRFLLLCQKFGHFCIENYNDGLFTNYEKSGNAEMQVRPDLILFFDISKHKKIKSEIFCLNIPVLAFVNTNDNIVGIDYPIPLNVNTWKGGVFLYNYFYHLFSSTVKI